MPSGRMPLLHSDSLTRGKRCCWIFVVVVVIVIDSRLNYDYDNDNENDLDTKTPQHHFPHNPHCLRRRVRKSEIECELIRRGERQTRLGTIEMLLSGTFTDAIMLCSIVRCLSSAVQTS